MSEWGRNIKINKKLFIMATIKSLYIENLNIHLLFIIQLLKINSLIRNSLIKKSLIHSFEIQKDEPV